jgi:uncharacterized protein YprB with RNaseH-like and TPR domain
VRLENSFIGVRGVGEKRERKLWRNGVTHWDEFDAGVVGETTAGRIESFLADARERLDDGDSRFFGRAFPSNERWRLYENFRDETVFFDIETTGLDQYQDDVTTVSFHVDGDTTTLVRGQDLTAERVREQFASASLVASFNGKRFDVPFLEAELGVSPDVPHLDLMYPCRRLDLDGGLKRIEREIGLDRDEPDISGRDAVRLWHEYERGSESSLETLVSYNRDDARNLRALADAVVDRLDDHVRPGDAPEFSTKRTPERST